MCKPLSKSAIKAKADQYPKIAKPLVLKSLVLEALGMEFVGCSDCEAGTFLTSTIEEIVEERRLRAFYDAARERNLGPKEIQAEAMNMVEDFPLHGGGVRKVLTTWMVADKLIDPPSLERCA